ncbi:hypothetical protein [Sinomicrobium weinanense]|uniref:Uncharacterized protein n=1 Tax=Sinomicrobium weinanense TaxID=2842200 RepID=A0A926Q2R8_9FLAO|nr:hypothetical protein [Sinomicrobium weinanense]MBC9796808.1 hypothetical protein [Sinomicrobium weinanense]MBU3123688.1 hypothetical protein [Sinomicrobium weinanense]
MPNWIRLYNPHVSPKPLSDASCFLPALPLLKNISQKKKRGKKESEAEVPSKETESYKSRRVTGGTPVIMRSELTAGTTFAALFLLLCWEMFSLL